MCNFYMMYYTEARNDQELSLTCSGNLFPKAFSQLPADNDESLPSNPALEEQAEDPNAPHVHVHGHMPGEEETPPEAEETPDEPEVADEPEVVDEPDVSDEPDVRVATSNGQTGNGRDGYDGDNFANRLYKEVIARRGGSTKGGAGSGRYLLNNYYHDYSDYGYNRPYKDYSDYDYYDVGNQRSRYRNRYGNQRNSGNAGGRPSNTAHAFFGFDDDDENAAWGWQRQSQQQNRRPVQGGDGGAAMGGPPSQPNNNRGRDGSETGYNLNVQKANNQFLPRQRAGARQQGQQQADVQPASPVKLQASYVNPNPPPAQKPKQPPQKSRKGGASPPPSK